MLAIDALQPSCFFLNPTNSIMQHSNPENTILLPPIIQTQTVPIPAATMDLCFSIQQTIT